MKATIRLTKPDAALIRFLNRCDEKGFLNNNTFKHMRFGWCMDQGGAWWATQISNEIVAVSGVHPFDDGYRVLFRGAQTSLRPFSGLNKLQKQNYCFVDHLPLQIEFANGLPVYVTTNSKNDNSGKMGRMNRAAQILADLGVLEYCYEADIYNVRQSVWRVNVDNYLKAMK